ncbi:MAG TPA: BT_3928 family protein, partial [Chitinophagaceae bacterium]|nr:BT_3928 family protein [Chitinophagaceae bacterium]
MKIAINIIRIFVGLLFIFSGLVKANDPLGTAYKMEEYFEVWNADLATSSFFLKNALTNLFHFLNDHTLFLSVTMNAFEIIAGAALLLGWRMKLFSWLLLLLMVFFTILTGYTYKTGRPTNCGCFGDCIKITPEYSFYKDVLLSILILVLLFARRHIKPLFSPGVNTGLMFLATVFSFGLQWYALRYLPPVDCLPFKKGSSIPEKMKMPANAVPDSIVMTFVYEKQGQKVEFTADKFPADFNDSVYKFVNRYDKLVRKGKNNEPPIRGFALTGAKHADSTGVETTTDSTLVILSQPTSLLLFNNILPDKDPAWKN